MPILAERAKQTTTRKKNVSKVLMHSSRWSRLIWKWAVECLSDGALIRLASVWMEPRTTLGCDTNFKFLITFASTLARRSRCQRQANGISLGAPPDANAIADKILNCIFSLLSKFWRWWRLSSLIFSQMLPNRGWHGVPAACLFSIGICTLNHN